MQAYALIRVPRMRGLLYPECHGLPQTLSVTVKACCKTLCLEGVIGTNRSGHIG